jgi:hypothetical protein
MKLNVVLALALVLLSTGALGLKTKTDCQTLINPLPDDLAICWHEAAISYASVGEKSAAEQSCVEVSKTNIGNAEGQSHKCFSDIAQYLRDSTICDRIQQSDPAVLFTGADVTSELCKKKVANLERVGDYKCALLSIPFLMLLGAVISFPREHS